MQIGGISAADATAGRVTGTDPAKPARDPELEKAAKAFEAIFLRQMIGAMRSSSLSEGIFDSSATQQFRDMADARTADQMAQTGKFGIAELLLRQFGAIEPLTPSVALKPEIAGAPPVTDDGA